MSYENPTNIGLIWTPNRSRFMSSCSSDGNSSAIIFLKQFLSSAVNKTRSPTIGRVRRNATHVNLKIAANILHVINGDLPSNHGRIKIWLHDGWICFVHCLQYSITHCSRLEVASDVISGVGAEEVGMDVSGVKLGDSRLKRSLCDGRQLTEPP